MPVREDCEIHPSVHIWHESLVNLYGCNIDEGSMIAAFCEIGPGVKIGKRCRIQARAFIPQNVVIEDDVFIGPGVTFTNDPKPWDRAFDWRGLPPTVVKKGATIAADVTILPGVIIGEKAIVGAGAVVTRNVPDSATWVGVPAQELRRFDGCRCSA